MLYKKNKKNKGFTLIEMMVSVSIFSIIMTVGMGALVNVMQKYKVSQEEKQATDSLNFVLETITREIKLGINYYYNPSTDGNTGVARDGQIESSSATLIGFDAADNRGYIIYRIASGILYRDKIILGVKTSEPMTDPSQVYINKGRVTVMNSGDPNDLEQPLVWVQFLSYPPNRPNSIKVIQTLVSQRVLDF